VFAAVSLIPQREHPTQKSSFLSEFWYFARVPPAFFFSFLPARPLGSGQLLIVGVASRIFEGFFYRDAPGSVLRLP